jgi:hypothetical protein
MMIAVEQPRPPRRKLWTTQEYNQLVAKRASILEPDAWYAPRLNISRSQTA